MSAKSTPTPAKSSGKAKQPAAKAPKTSVAKTAKPAARKKPEAAAKAASKKPSAAVSKPGTAEQPDTEMKTTAVAKTSEPAKKKPAAAPAVSKKPAAATNKGVEKAATTTKPTGKAEPTSPKETKSPAKETKSPAKEAKSPAKAADKAPPVRRSSLVDFPVPPPPVKPPFVPPKQAPLPTDGPVAPGSNGTHSAAFIQKQRQRLLDLRDDLVDAMSGMTRDTIRNAPEGSEASGSGMHQGDAGSDAYDRDFALSVLAKEQDALYEIEQALRRIQKGTYGSCEISGRKIPQPRLEAIPFARLTVECQAQWEKEYGNRRFRPSNEVGFSGGNYIEDEDSDSVSLDDDED